MKTINLFSILSAFFLMSLTTGCIDDLFIDGNGIPGSENRITRDFTEVTSSGNYTVHITYGKNYDIVVNAETNLLPYIETNVRGSTLHIETRGIHSLVNHLPIEVNITTPVIEGLAVSGSGLITTDYFISEKMTFLISGSGKIDAVFDAHNIKSAISGSGQLKISGITDYADFAISGSGKIIGGNLLISDCDANVSGSGEMYVNVEKFLFVRISGSGNVFYSGMPLIESHISGSGKLIRKS